MILLLFVYCGLTLFSTYMRHIWHERRITVNNVNPVQYPLFFGSTVLYRPPKYPWFYHHNAKLSEETASTIVLTHLWIRDLPHSRRTLSIEPPSKKGDNRLRSDTMYVFDIPFYLVSPIMILMSLYLQLLYKVMCIGTDNIDDGLAIYNVSPMCQLQIENMTK